MSIPKTICDREYKKFVESPTRPDQTAIEVVGEFNVDVDGLPDLTSCNESKVTDGACQSGETVLKAVSTEILAAIGATNKADHKSVLIQPRGGDILFGHTSGQLHHLLTSNNFYEAQGITNLYIEAVSGTVNVAISEFE